MSEQDFTITREFDAPRELVFEILGAPYLARSSGGSEVELIARDGSLAVEVVNAEQPPPAGMASAQVAAGGSQQGAEMERTGRGRREATAGRARASGTSRRGRRTASRGARAAPAPRCRASPPAVPRGA